MAEFTERMIHMLVEHEALRLKPYRDSVGKLTIGIGRNLDDRGLSYEEQTTLLLAHGTAAGVELSGTRLSARRDLKDGISEEEARWLCANDVERVCAELDAAYPWWREMADARQMALADMSFNLGAKKLAKFRPTLDEMRDGNWEEVALRLRRTAWYRQTGRRARRVIEMLRRGEPVDMSEVEKA